MVLLDVSFGIFAFTPYGWLFMLFVILCEAILMSKCLAKANFNKLIYWSQITGNVVSGITGIIISMALNGGWWLVVWFPWVSKHEVNIHHHGQLMWLIIYYLVAFLLTLIIEFGINYLFLHKSYHTKRIGSATLKVNIATYVWGAILLALLVC